MPPQENNVPITSTEKPTPILKRNIKYAFLLVLTFLLIATGAFGIWYFSNPASNEETDMSVSLIKQNQFSDWKTYRNEEYGFEFKYPKEWINNSDPLTKNISFGPTKDSFDFWLQISKMDKIDESLLNGSCVNDVGLSCVDIINNDILNIGNVVGRIIKYCPMACSSKIIFNHNNIIYEVRLMDPDGLYCAEDDCKEESKEDLEKRANKENKIIYQILSTFKFISTSTQVVINTSNWKTYTNEEYGFEIEIPEDWTTEHYSSVLDLCFSSQKTRKFEQENNLNCSGRGNGICIPEKPCDIYFYNRSNIVNANHETLKQEKINGINFSTYTESGMTDMYYIETTKENRFFSFGFINYENKQILTQILSTFKFTK
jgi:hypothetical protein